MAIMMDDEEDSDQLVPPVGPDLQKMDQNNTATTSVPNKKTTKLTIMMDDEDYSDRLLIDEREPPDSPADLQKTVQKNTVPTPVPDNTTELRNFRKSANLPPVNYLSLMGNDTLNTIQNNMLNTTEKHRIPLKDFARIPEAISNENSDSVLYALLTENSTNFQAYFDATVPMDEALKAVAQNKDPRAGEAWVPTSNTADQREPIGHTIHTDPPHVLSVSRIPQNAYGDRFRMAPNGNSYEVQNGKIIPHTTSAHNNTRQNSVIEPNANAYEVLNGNRIPHTSSAHMNAGLASTVAPNASAQEVQNGNIVPHTPSADMNAGQASVIAPNDIAYEVRIRNSIPHTPSAHMNAGQANAYEVQNGNRILHTPSAHQASMTTPNGNAYEVQNGNTIPHTQSAHMNASAYEVQNGNIIPHRPSAHMNARQGSVVAPNANAYEVQNGNIIPHTPSTPNGNAYEVQNRNIIPHTPSAHMNAGQANAYEVQNGNRISHTPSAHQSSMTTPNGNAYEVQNGNTIPHTQSAHMNASAYEVQNGNIIPHRPSAHMNARQGSVVAPNANAYEVQNGNSIPHTPSAHMNAGQANAYEVQNGNRIPHTPSAHQGSVNTPNGNAYEVQNGNTIPHTQSAHMNARQANAYEVQNGNIIPHTPSAYMNARHATVIIPNSRNLLGGTMTYPPSTQHNGNTIPTAHNSRVVQDGPTQYIDVYNRPHNSLTDASARMNYQRTRPIIKFPSGYPCSRPTTIPAHTLNRHPCNTRPPPSPYIYACMTCNCQRLASANTHMMPANPHNVLSTRNGNGQYSTSSIPQAPDGRETLAYLAEISKACLQRNPYKMEAMRTETTHVVSSGHANQKPGVKTTNKRTYTKISKNSTQVVNNNPEIPASYNAMGNGVHYISNSDAIENEETTAIKKVARPNKNASKVSAAIPVSNQVHGPPKIVIQQTRNNIDIPSIFDATSDCTQPIMKSFPDVTQLPVTAETHLPPTTMRTNASANIRTVSHYIDIADETQPPINKEDNFKQTAMNNNNATTGLIEAQKGTMNMDSNIVLPVMNTELAIIKHNRDEQIPLIMDHQADIAFIPPPHNINSQDASTLLDYSNDKALTDLTASPKTLIQPSSSHYDVNLTTLTTRTISHNIERNEVLRSNTVNTDKVSLLDIERASSILNTVDYRTETRLTNVEVVNHISNISVENLKDILNKVQQMPIKTAAIVGRTGDNQVNKCNDMNKTIATTMADDNPQEIVSKHDGKLAIVRKKLAKLRTIEFEHVVNIGQKGNGNQYQIKIGIGPNGEYIVQVITFSSDGSYVEEELIQINCSTSNTEQVSISYTENMSHSLRERETEVLEEKKSIENNQEINETRESIIDETYDKANGCIDETLFFNFQIKFFRHEQEKLCQELANKLSKDIYDLIAISDDKSATADMKYKCHICRNTTIYSPRVLYYKLTNHQEVSMDTVQNCPECITFRMRYINKLMIEFEAPKQRIHSEYNPNAVKSTDVRQSKSENSIHNDKYSKDNRQKEICEIESQLSFIINGVPSNSKKAKIDDHTWPNAEHVLDVSKTTENSKTNDFVVKLPINILKESTVRALMQNSKSHPKKAVRAEATLNISTDHNSNKEQRKNFRTKIVSSKIAEKRNRDVNKSPNICVSERGIEVKKINEATMKRMYGNSNIDHNKENPHQIVKSISAQDATGTNTEVQNNNTFSASHDNEHNGKYQKTPHKIWRSFSGTSPLKIKLRQIETDSQTNITSKSSNNNEAIVSNKENQTKKRASVNIISNEVVTGINLETTLSVKSVIVSGNGHTNKSQEKNRKITERISVETASINNTGRDENNRKNKSIGACATSNNTFPTSNSSDHIDRNVEGNRGGRKRISSDITNEELPNVTTNVSNKKQNNNTLINNRDLSKTIETDTINISKATTNAEANKSDSAKASQVTPAITEKEASRSYEKRRNNDKRLNDVENNETNDGKKATSENRESSSDKDQTLEKILLKSFETIKANCSSKEELPEVKIRGKKQKTESKEHKPLEDVEKQNKNTHRPFSEFVCTEFVCKVCTKRFKSHQSCITHMKNDHNINNKTTHRPFSWLACKVCTMRYKYHQACINHMKNNHKIENLVIPPHCLFMECTFCGLSFTLTEYNAHLRNAHSDKVSEHNAE